MTNFKQYDKYKVFFKWNDGDYDSFNTDDYKTLKDNCIAIINSPLQTLLGIEKRNQYGEYIEKDIPKTWFKLV